jgi:hypothetical protein
MRLTLLKEAGYSEALLGLSLSFYDHDHPLETWWDISKQDKAAHRSTLLAGKDGGHNKFLESIQVWVYIQATRGFWQEFDTYRAGVTKQSSSTMHTLDKRFVGRDDFEVGTSDSTIEAFNDCLIDYKDETNEFFKDITRLKENLPEGWLQERVVCTNYKTLRNILSQRSGHRYKHWRTFCEFILNNIEHPELLELKS